MATAQRKGALLDPALNEFKRLQTEENTPQAYLNLARTFRDRGLLDEEERALRKCVQLDGRFPACHYDLHVLFAERRRVQDAATACKNFLKYGGIDEFPKEVETCERFLRTAMY